MLVDLLNDLIENELKTEPQPEKKRVAFRDPLAKFPLGKQERIDQEADSRIGKLLTRESWEGF